MKYCILLLSLSTIFACSSEKDVPNDAAARASGQYMVQSYAVNGDTLYTSTGINKINGAEFSVSVGRKKPDSVQIAISYKKTGNLGSVIYLKTVGVHEVSGAFQLSWLSAAVPIYESNISGNTFYEHTLKEGIGFMVLPPNYSLKTPVSPAVEGVVISAVK